MSTAQTAGNPEPISENLLVHEDVYDELLEKLAARSADVVVGNPADPATGVGPMSTETHFHKVMGYIESGVAEGARVACGGKQAQVPGCVAFLRDKLARVASAPAKSIPGSS